MAKKAKPKAGPERPEPTYEKRNIDDLKPHEKQGGYFADLSEEELDRLVDSIERNGLETPVQITSDNRIIKGHQRIRAAKRLGWTEIDVCVRSDLDGDEEAIERELISDNLDRRQLSPIEMALAFRRLKEIEKGRPRKKGDGESKGDLRDRLAKKFDRTGRYLDMLENVLDTPEVILGAVVQNRLAVTKAMAVAALDENTQQELAEELTELIRESATETDGKDMLTGRIKARVDLYLRDHAAKSKGPKKPKKSRKPDEDVKRFVKELETAIGGIGRVLNSRPRLKLTVSLRKLKGAKGKLDELVRKAESRSAS